MIGTFPAVGEEILNCQRRQLAPADDGYVSLFSEDVGAEDTFVLDRVEIITEGWAGVM